MYIYNYGTDIRRNVTLQDGEAILEIDRLSEGTYTLQCTYDSNDDISQTYTATSNFVVKKPDIIVKKFNILGTDNLYNTILDIELEDTFGEKINYWKGKKLLSKSAYREYAVNPDVKAKIPVIFISGFYDYTTPITLSKELYEKLEAPAKYFYTFNNSAHSPLWEENELVIEAMLKHVR